MERALQIAVEAHSGQKDKYGAPLIFHPLRIMNNLADPMGKIAALLHDVVEKSRWSLKDLEREGFPGEILKAVDLLTRHAGEDYQDYLERVKTDALAIRVKLADLADHMDTSRMNEMTPQILKKLKKTHTSWTWLKKFDIL